MRPLASLLILALLSCGGRVKKKTTDPIKVKSAQFCFLALVKYPGGMDNMFGCTDSLRLCEIALDLARRYGGIAGIESLSECVVTEADVVQW